MRHSSIQSAYAYIASLHAQLSVDYYFIVVNGKTTITTLTNKTEADKILGHSLDVLHGHGGIKKLSEYAEQIESIQKEMRATKNHVTKMVPIGCL